MKYWAILLMVVTLLLMYDYAFVLHRIGLFFWLNAVMFVVNANTLRMALKTERIEKAWRNRL